MSLFVSWRWLAVAVVGGVAMLRAAEAPKGKEPVAITDLAAVDADYALQGEYMGKAHQAAGEDEGVGLQIIALGDSKFDVVYLRGGLPGAGWDRKTKVKLHGEQQNGTLVCRNEHRELTVTPERAVMRNARGEVTARLEKILRVSPTMHAAPPTGATILFNGQDTTELTGGKLTNDGLLKVGALTKQPVGDFHLHVEFRTPYMPTARGQARGNSGVYIQQRYEVQVLDSFGLDGVENECGGIYRQQRPDLNMCLPPLRWQTYDIDFQAPRWDDDGKKIANAKLTVYHNGEPIHLNRELKTKTGAGKAESPEQFPILFQDHGNPVHFRNVWIIHR